MGKFIQGARWFAEVVWQKGLLLGHLRRACTSGWGAAVQRNPDILLNAKTYPSQKAGILILC